MASAMYNTGKQKLVNGTIVWGSNDARVALVQSGYTFDADHDDMADITNELAGTGYSRQALANEAINLDDANDRVEFDADDVVFSSLNADNGTIAAAIIFEYNAVDANAQLIAYIDLTDTACNGGDVTIQWNAEGIFYV